MERLCSVGVLPWLKEFNFHGEFNLIRMIFHQVKTSVRFCERAFAV